VMPRPSPAGRGARSERRLLREAKAGSVTSVDELVRLHWDSAYRAAYLIVQDAAIAEDIAQEALVSTVEALDRFDWRRPLRPYLHRIAVNRSLDWLRAKRTRPEISLEAVTPPEAHAADQPQALSASLAAAFALLHPEDRAAVVLRYVLGYSPKEVGVMLGVPGSTARSRLSRALERLRNELDEREDPDGR
jgi:RNA polymerase sigma-70 factor, ECF subfamily